MNGVGSVGRRRAHRGPRAWARAPRGSPGESCRGGGSASLARAWALRAWCSSSTSRPRASTPPPPPVERVILEIHETGCAIAMTTRNLGQASGLQTRSSSSRWPRAATSGGFFTARSSPEKNRFLEAEHPWGRDRRVLSRDPTLDVRCSGRRGTVDRHRSTTSTNSQGSWHLLPRSRGGSVQVRVWLGDRRSTSRAAAHRRGAGTISRRSEVPRRGLRSGYRSCTTTSCSSVEVRSGGRTGSRHRSRVREIEAANAPSSRAAIRQHEHRATALSGACQSRTTGTARPARMNSLAQRRCGPGRLHSRIEERGSRSGTAAIWCPCRATSAWNHAGHAGESGQASALRLRPARPYPTGSSPEERAIAGYRIDGRAALLSNYKGE
jgi:hypothetical protein